MNWLTEHIKRLFSFLIYGLLLTRQPSDKANCADEETAIISTGALGDFIVSCSAIKMLFMQDRRLTLICRKNMGIEEFARMTGYFKTIISLPHRFCKRFNNLHRLQKVHVNTVFILPPERHVLSDLYALSVCADVRVFPDTLQGCSLPSLKRVTDKRADRLIPVNAGHELERQEQLLRGCGLFDHPLYPFVFQPDTEKKTRKGQLILVFPGSGVGQIKQWPTERFAFVVDKLCREYKCEAVICGTEKEKDVCGKLHSQLRVPAENLCGQTSLFVLGEWFSKCALVLANDSGSAHLAIAFGAPTVIVCGGWEYGRFYPNPRLPGNCEAVVVPPESLPCIPCGESRPACTVNTAAPCLAAVEQNVVLDAARRCILLD